MSLYIAVMPRLFKRCVALYINRIKHNPADRLIWKTNCAIYWIESYPVESLIQLLNNLDYKLSR